MEMNHCVPEFEIEDDNSIPNRSSKGGEDELVGIVWQNGEVVLQSQNQTSLMMKKSPIRESSSIKITQQPPTASEAPYQLFMQEDEMASLLHYPLEDDFSSPGVADLLYLTPTTKFGGTFENFFI